LRELRGEEAEERELKLEGRVPARGRRAEVVVVLLFVR
jgi:hypothetical protein